MGDRLLAPTGSSIHRIASGNVPPAILLSKIGGSLAGPNWQLHSSHRIWERSIHCIVSGNGHRLQYKPRLDDRLLVSTGSPIHHIASGNVPPATILSQIGGLATPEATEGGTAPQKSVEQRTDTVELGSPLTGPDRQIHSSHRC